MDGEAGMKTYLGVVVLTLLTCGCHFFGFGGQTETVYLTNLIENDAKVWKPATLEAYAGKVVFEVENTLDEPHGFVVKGVKDPVVVGPLHPIPPRMLLPTPKPDLPRSLVGVAQ